MQLEECITATENVVNDAEFADLKRRMDEDCHRVAHVARTREKKAATPKEGVQDVVAGVHGQGTWLRQAGRAMKFSEADIYSIPAINYAIEIACLRSLPWKARVKKKADEHLGTQLIDDIQQDVWVEMLESSEQPNARMAYKFARHRCSKWIRKDSKTMPVSQMDLPTADPDDADSELKMPWDGIQQAVEPAWFVADAWETILDDSLHDYTRDALRALDKKDQRFLTRYLANKQAHSPAQRKRYQRLVDKMRAHYAQFMSQAA
jgi:hypothetical protein